MPLILAVENQKGGCGKTTLTINLAGGFHKAGYRTFVVDADPQASALSWSIANGQGSLPFDVTTARLLKHKVSSLLESDAELILVDCPPGIADASDIGGKFARDCLREADAILVPLRPSTLDFKAAETFVRYLVQHKRPETRTAIVINGRQHNRLGDQAAAMAATYFAPIDGAVVHQNQHRPPHLDRRSLRLGQNDLRLCPQPSRHPRIFQPHQGDHRMASPRAGIAPPDFSNLHKPFSPVRERLAPTEPSATAPQPPVVSPAPVGRATAKSAPASNPLSELYPELSTGRRERTTHCSLRLPVSQMDSLDALVAAGARSVNALVVSFIAKALRELEVNR